MGFEETINEGILKLTIAQRRQLDKFIDRLKSKYPPSNSGYDPDELVEKLNLDSLRYYDNSYQFPYINFVYDASVDWGGLYDKKEPRALNINLYHLSINENDKIYIISWNKIKATIIHEWIHKKQYNIGGVKGLCSKASWEYFNQPREMMPWAAMEVEELRTLLKTTDKRRILRILKKLGLTSPGLKELKHEQPKAWRRIMKNAVMYTLSTMD